METAVCARCGASIYLWGRRWLHFDAAVDAQDHHAIFEHDVDVSGAVAVTQKGKTQ